jgi:hypothetical protein
MMASANDNDVTATSDDKSESLIDKPMSQDEINKKNFKPGYAYFILFLTLMARIMVQW